MIRLSALATSLPEDLASALPELRVLGFVYVDLVALAERPPSHLEALADSGLLVSCGAIGRGLPDGCTLDAPSVDIRRTAIEGMKHHLADIAHLGGTYAYLVPGKDGSAPALARFAEACAVLADFAGGRMVRLCIEHAPGTALPSAAATLALLQQIGHENLGLLMDVGHCLLSGEDPAAVVVSAGNRLFYIHLDDNDGVSDLHWPLLRGRLTQEILHATFASLRDQDYAGPLALELRAENAEPAEGLRQGKQLVERILRSL
jgi:sugar phosphate isomerase/epimerase